MVNQRLAQVRAQAKIIEQEQLQQGDQAPQEVEAQQEPIQQELAPEPEQIAEMEIENDQPVAEAEAPKNDREINLRILRERNEKYERDQEQMVKFLKAQQEEIDRLKYQTQQRQAEPDELDSMDDTDYMDVGKVKKLVNKEVQKHVAELKRSQEHLNNQNLEANILKKCPDFSSVVTAENVAALKEKSPAIALAVTSIPDNLSYEKAIAAYEAIKSLGIGAAPTHQYDENKERIAKNLAKPRPAAAFGARPLDNAAMFQGPLTPEKKRQIREDTARLKLIASAGRN